MKKLLGFAVFSLTVLFLCSCQNKIEKIISKYKLQNIDTLYLAAAPGYTYDITFRKIEIGDEGESESEVQQENFLPVLVTASGKVVYVPTDQIINLRYNPFEDVVSIPFSGDSSGMDTSHIWVYYDGQDEPVLYPCVNGVASFPCGNEWIAITCAAYGMEYHCDSPPPSENE